MRTPYRLYFSRLCFSALFFSGACCAAELEEVIVEAQHISDTFKAEAVAQSTLSREWISDLYVDTFEELSFFVPGLYVQEEGVNSAAYAIRGMTTNNTEATRTPRVSVWMHGMDISRSQGAYTALYDIDRVDVYKGPVGSLFARGGQIGGIDLTNHLAELNTSGEISTSTGSFNEFKVHGFYNQQLSDSNALRVALFHHQREGYIKNSDGTDLNSVATDAGRVSFAQMFNETRLDIQANVEQNRPHGLAFQSFDYAPCHPYEDSMLDNAENLRIKRDIADIFAKIMHPFDENFSGDAVFLYRDVKTGDVFDPDGTRLNLVQADESADYSTLETQFKLHYFNDNYQSTLGVGYFHEDVSVLFAAHINEQLAVRLPVIQNLPDLAGLFSLLNISNDLFDSNGNPNPYTTYALTDNRYEQQTESVDNESASIFFDNTYHFNTALSMSAGLRYSQETLYTQIVTPPFSNGGQNTLTSIIGNLFLVPLDPSLPKSSSQDTVSGLSGRISLNYAVTDTLSTFVTYARGRRPDILNFTEQSVLEHLLSETVDSYETGLHFDNKATYSTLDLSAYIYDFKHFATSVSGVSALSVLSDDNASASVQGMEAAYTQFFSHEILLFSNLTYNDAVFDQSAIITGTNRFRYAPLWSGAVSLSKDFSVTADWRSRLTWQESFQTEIFFEDDNSSNLGRNRQGGYGLMNIYLDFRYRKNLTLNTFIKNATDKQFIIDAGNFGQLFGLPTFVPGLGRNIGAGVTYAF